MELGRYAFLEREPTPLNYANILVKPNKAIGVTRAQIKIGDIIKDKQIDTTAASARFSLDLKPGDYDLQTWLKPGSNAVGFGALFVICVYKMKVRLKRRLSSMKSMAVLAPFTVLVLCSHAFSQLAAAGDSVVNYWDTKSDTWVATDGLDRRIATHDKVGPLREGKQLAMFYFLWHGAHGQSGPHDISKVLIADPEAMKKPNSPLWGPWMNYHHWGEPLFGYYLSTDEWVYRKHAQMLSDAQVDVVIFDTSNRHTYKQSYMALCSAFTEVRKAGGKTPRIAFLAPFSPSPESITQTYNDLYKQGLYKDLWYYWQGKPLMMAFEEGLSIEVKDFFTFRKPVPGLSPAAECSKPVVLASGSSATCLLQRP